MKIGRGRELDAIAGTVTSYFERLVELSQNMHASDEKGVASPLDAAAEELVKMILSIKKDGGKIMLVANGGSAAIVSHMHNDLSKAVGVRAMVFNEPPLLTALTNDEGYENAFKRCVDLWAQRNDMLIAISSSGRSANILNAVKSAIGLGARVVTLSGFDSDNPLRRLGEINFFVNSHIYGYVELAHSSLTHFLTDRAVSCLCDAEHK